MPPLKDFALTRFLYRSFFCCCCWPLCSIFSLCVSFNCFIFELIPSIYHRRRQSRDIANAVRMNAASVNCSFLFWGRWDVEYNPTNKTWASKVQFDSFHLVIGSFCFQSRGHQSDVLFSFRKSIDLQLGLVVDFSFLLMPDTAYITYIHNITCTCGFESRLFFVERLRASQLLFIIFLIPLYLLKLRHQSDKIQV